MKIIQASQTHIDKLVPLFDGYRIFYKKQSNLEAAKLYLGERFQKNDSVIFLALDEKNNGLGFTQLYPSYSSVAMQRTYILNDLFVSPEARGQGVGEALMNKAKEFAVEKGSRGLTLETDHDNPAQKLYTRLGWKKDVAVNHFTWEV
ncbi:acetyltransferase (GNAT) family protein [Ulvibacter sp. MAR_2010_11]|uniref:GNAT family N-acetyltransferase n=1 Tax=Ulvibacter sp. MAR_2010_11 TaxID=1250229 RepID=UPI000C2C61A7|nr:GNAT family N-acetyltransferase [Ulvibacter sp. MAR_2010_11]PKA81919.1 acetyltransferase (GNAT) family protein [Ulvibacter sp. MAR_2010_11]